MSPQSFGTQLTLIFRNAVDFGLPLINNAKLAVLWVETLKQKMPLGALKPYSEGQIPVDVKSWREWVPHA